MSEMTQAGFDYSALPVDSILTARAAAERIKLRLKRTVEDIIEIGRELTAVKNELPHGQFSPWIAAEFEMSRETSDNFMSVYKRFGDGKLVNFTKFKPSILYALSAPSTPESVIDKAVAKVESGEHVTVADVKDWKAELEAERERREAAERVLLETQQRASEFGKESNERRLKIRDLEEQISLLGNQSKPEPEIQIVEKIPDDYESIKLQAVAAKNALEKLQKEQNKLVNDQVKAKLRGYQDEVNEMEKKKASIEEVVARKKAYLDSLSSEVKRVETHREVINGSRLELIGLAGFLNDLDPMNDQDTIKRWLALADMHQAAADSIRIAFGNHSPELRIAA